MHETVAEHCTHKDCVYRGRLYNTPICQYALIEGQCRKCEISKCDKYRQGEPIKPRMTEDFMIEWEYEFYDQDADSIWSRFERTEV